MFFLRGEAMAELLIRAKTNGLDPTVHWQRGHVVYVTEDGHEWGLRERPPEFYVVRLPGVSREAAWQAWRTGKQVGTNEFGEPEFSARPPRGIDVDAAMQPPKAARRMPRLMSALRRVRAASLLDRGEKLSFRYPPARGFF